MNNVRYRTQYGHQKPDCGEHKLSERRNAEPYEGGWRQGVQDVSDEHTHPNHQEYRHDDPDLLFRGKHGGTLPPHTWQGKHFFDSISLNVSLNVRRHRPVIYGRTSRACRSREKWRVPTFRPVAKISFRRAGGSQYEHGLIS
jgi:hypothetical protein